MSAPDFAAELWEQGHRDHFATIVRPSVVLFDEVPGRVFISANERLVPAGETISGEQINIVTRQKPAEVRRLLAKSPAGWLIFGGVVSPDLITLGPRQLRPLVGKVSCP